MITPNTMMICDTCGEGFCEIIDKDFHDTDIIKETNKAD
jgi:hypothetical protein